MELYWNGDIKYTVSDNDFWKKYYYEYDGSTILDGEEHLMELPKNTTSIVMRVYPKQGYIPAFRVFDASTQSEEGKVLTGEYNEKDGYYELVYKITDDCIYNNDGSLNGYIRISPEYNFDSSFADDLSGMVYFDNSQVKWEKVYAWAWNEADELWALNHGFEEWPGIELYYDQNTGYYFWQCEDLSGANVMFNNFGRGLQTNNDAASGALAGYVCKPTSIDDKGKYNAVWEKVKTETAHTHTVVIDKAVAATCEEKGKTEGSHCSECGEIIKKQEVIPATGHTVVTDKAVAATCEKSGKTEGSHCSACGKVIKKQNKVAATGHKYTKTTVKAKPGSNGSVYQKCSKCGHKEVLSTIYAPKTVACTKTSYVYNGKAIKPIITVKDTKGKVIGSSHYTIEYSKNINVGTGSVKVVFKGNNYSGSLSTTFTITKANNSLSGKTSYNKTADSKKQTFVLDMKAKGGSITYKSNNKNVSVDKKGKVTIQKNFSGIVTITVTAGNNNYKTITKDITLTIKPGVTSIKTLRNTSDNGARRGKVTVTWNKLSYVSGYQVQYSNVSSYIGAGSTYNISNVSTLSKEISNLIKGRTYYVRVRTYHKVGKKTLYGPWSDTKSIRIS